MKKLILVVLLFFAFLFISHSTSKTALAACMTITGSVQLNSGVWPAGAGGLQLACAGDSPAGPSQCTGNSQTVMPGQSFTFTKCSCLAGNCLSIANVSVPPGCSFESSVNFCGANAQTVNAPIRLNCPPPPAPPCPAGDGFCGNSDGSNTTACAATGADTTSWNPASDNYCANKYGGSRGRCFARCKPAPTASPTPTPTTVQPACGVACTRPSDCAGARDGCTVCSAGGRCEAPPTPTVPPGVPTPTTGVPTPTTGPGTPTPTDVPPACNVSCVRNSDCAGARDGCTVCSPDNKCAPPATPTSPPVCGTPCDRDADCSGARNGCEVCLPTGGGGAKVCSPRPTATPTPPPFDEAMCKCDGLQYGSLVLGYPANITAFGKVEGTDTQYARIPGFTFSFYESGTGTNVTKLEEERVNATIIQDTPTLARYQSDWTLDLPPTLDTTKTYRIQAKPVCEKKTAFFNPSQTRTNAVLAVEDEPKSFLDRIISFFIGLFQGSRPQQTQTPPPTPTMTEDQKASLQLQTVRPATNIEEGKDQDNCTFIKFSF